MENKLSKINDCYRETLKLNNNYYDFLINSKKETLYFLFRTMETVAWETPALFATSEEVAFFLDKVMPPFPMIFCQNSNLKAPHAPQEHVKESLRQYIPDLLLPELRLRSC